MYECIALIVNGKLFVEPPSDVKDFKVLFLQLMAAGAGRPVDDSGFSLGAWTPELLATAISSFDRNPSGVELRTVQHWFQDNDKGVSGDNLRWLSRVFGCDDPDKSAIWQTHLTTTYAKFAADRRRMRRDVVKERSKKHAYVGRKADGPTKNNFSKFVARRFGADELFGLLVFLWAGCSALLFLSFVLGTHDIVYEPVVGVMKQVGLFYSPNWLIDKLLWLPLITFFVGGLVTLWSGTLRPGILELADASEDIESWDDRLGRYALSFWGISVVCLCIVFLMQWYGGYALPLMSNDVGVRVVDWLLVAIVRPDVVSTDVAVWVSLFANFLSGVGYWFCFSGLLLLYIVCVDLKELCVRVAKNQVEPDCKRVDKTANDVLSVVFACAVFSLLISIGIKVVAIYLMTDTSNLFSWLFMDFIGLFVGSGYDWTWFDKTPTGSITGFFMMFIPVFVFFLCMSQVYGALTGTAVEERKAAIPFMLWLWWSVLIFSLVVNFWLIGRYHGFTGFLLISICVSLFTVFKNRHAGG